MEASLSYLARFSSTRAGLARHLKKKFRHAEGEALSALLEECLARLEEFRLLDDARFAADRARGLRAQGKSGRAIRQKLAEKGVDRALVDEAMRDEDAHAELVAAVRLAKRRRLGPFRTKDADEMRELAALGRAGFSYEIARKVLALDLSDAEAMIAAR